MTINLFDIEAHSDALHPKVEHLMMMPHERAILETWSERFTDRDGNGKFVYEFRTTFHSSFLELYLHAALKAQHMAVDLSHHAPDFLVTGPVPFAVEAVIAGIKNDGRAEDNRTVEDVESMFVPPWQNAGFKEALAEGAVRYSSALTSKAKKYLADYSKLPWMPPELPYVIALGSFSQVNYGSEYHYSILALLFGYVFDASSRDFIKQHHIRKPGTNALIDIDLFSREDFAHVAAVIFTCTLTLGKLTSLVISAGIPSMNSVRLMRSNEGDSPYSFQTVSEQDPEDLLDGLFILHNPNATHPLSLSTFADTNAVHIRAAMGGLTFESPLPPLMARMSRTKAEGGDLLMDMLCHRAHIAFNE